MKTRHNKQIGRTSPDPISDDGKKYRVLIAEDSPISCTLLQKTIEKWGHEVIVTRDGDEAWDALRTQDIRLAVLDWMMPGIDGLEVCRRVRAMGNGRYTYLIMLTAKGRKKDIAEALHAGADDHLTKPFDRDELRARIGIGERILRMQDRLIAAEREVRHAHTELAQIFNSAPDGLCVIDKDYNVNRVNDTFLDLARVGAIDVANRKCYETMVNPLCHTDACPLTRIFNGDEQVETETEIVPAGGPAVPCIITGIPFRDSHGGLVGIVEGYRDITTRKREEQKRLERERLKATIELAGAACHELNQPLQAISGYAELLQMRVGEGQTGRAEAKTIVEQVKRMTHVTRKLQNLNRYITQAYTEGTNIVDLYRASGDHKADSGEIRDAG